MYLTGSNLSENYREFPPEFRRLTSAHNGAVPSLDENRSG